MKESQMKNLKLNYHMLESCNYGCKFCFARYAKSEHLSLAEMQQLIGRIAESGFFSAINFAGGEPFLVKQLPELIKFAKKCGLETSVITNGSLLTIERLNKVLPHLDWIGISFHSLNDEIKRNMGFCSKDKTLLSNERLTEIVRFVRSNSNCKIKINTVVNAFNKGETFFPFIQDNSIDRWKVLRCQSFGNNNDLLISDEEWNSFCERNKGGINTVFEDTMKDTYIMVNPMGMMLKEASNGREYEEIGSVLEGDLKELLLQHPLHVEEYQKRYI